MTEGLTRALQIVDAEIARAEALLTVEEGGEPVFDLAQTEAGIAALRVVAEAIRREIAAGVQEVHAALPKAPITPCEKCQPEGYGWRCTGRCDTAAGVEGRKP